MRLQLSTIIKSGWKFSKNLLPYTFPKFLSSKRISESPLSLIRYTQPTKIRIQILVLPLSDNNRRIKKLVRKLSKNTKILHKIQTVSFIRSYIFISFPDFNSTLHFDMFFIAMKRILLEKKKFDPLAQFRRTNGSKGEKLRKNNDPNGEVFWERRT